MKKRILNLAVITCMAGTIFIGCQSSAKKVEDAKSNVIEAQAEADKAQSELNSARQDSINDYLAFKKEAQAKINAQEKSIAEFKSRIANEKKVNKVAYEEKIAKLEQKNSDLKKRLDDYKGEGKDQWTAFKTEFNHDMDELGKAFSDLTVKNVK